MHGAVVYLLRSVQASCCKLAAGTDFVQSYHQLRSGFQCGYHTRRYCAYYVPGKRRPPTASAASAVQPATTVAKSARGWSTTAAGLGKTTATAERYYHDGY